jgi:CheY-like chemotaxis protein
MLKFLFSQIPAEIAQPRILLIDDDRDIRTITNLVLLTQQVGEVLEAGSGQEGIAAARTKRPDVILLDMRLPDISGETVLQLLRADPWTRDIPVVLFTSLAGDIKRLKTLGVSDIVLKPFHAQSLCSVIRRVLDSRGQNANSLPPQMPVQSVSTASIATAMA